MLSVRVSVDLIFVRADKIELVVVCRPIIAWFTSEHRNWPGFREWTSSTCGGSNLAFLNVCIEITWKQLTVVLCGWSQFYCILYSGWKYLDLNEFTHRIRRLSCARSWLAFSVSGRSRLDFSVSTKSIWLLCRWSKLTWFQRGGSELSGFQFKNRNWLVLCVAVKKSLFYGLDRDYLGFCVGA